MILEDTNDNITQHIDPALDPSLDQLSRRRLLEKAGTMVAGVAMITGSDESDAQAASKVRALDNPHLHKSDVEFTSNAIEGSPAQIKGFLAEPEKPGKHGSIIVIHEIFGLTDHIRDIACRLAVAGYSALAINLFTREGNPPPMEGGFAPLMEFVGKVSDAQILGDVKAGVHYLQGLSDSSKKIGIVGFCWGGRVSMLSAAKVSELAAAVAYYGRITGNKTSNQPEVPLDVAAQMKAPLLGHFGAKDQSIPVGDVEKLKAALKAAGKKAELHVYEKAGHAFNNDTRESYQAESAQLAWKRTLDWYHKYLK